MAKDTVPVLNPATVSWRELSRRLGPRRAAPVWQQIISSKKGGSSQKVQFRLMRPKGVDMAAKKKIGLEAMPREWREEWAKRLKEYVSKLTPEVVQQALRMAMPAEWKESFKAGVARAAGRKKVEMPEEWVSAWKRGVAQMQPMAMPEEWRRAWARGLLERGPTSPLARQYEEQWRAGIQKYATEQPLAALGAVSELLTTEGLTDLLSVTTGILSGTIAPAAILSKVFKVTPTPTTELLTGLGLSAAGSALLSATGQYRMGRLFLFASVGTLLARFIMEKLMPRTTTAGLGQAEVEKAIKEEVTRILREEGVEGLGVITTRETPLEGESGLGVVSTTPVELEGIGQVSMDVEPF